jgi:predicted dienelactone hydrolase
MKIAPLFILNISMLLLGCAARTKTPPFQANTHINADVIIKVDTASWFDSSRSRLIPIATYQILHSNTSGKKLVILNPGYGGKNTDYGYIATDLALNGYFVVTVQHDLPTDSPLPQIGDIYKSRKPIWDRGVKSIFFVVQKIRNKYPLLDYTHIILIGHSNGGDMAMFIANEYPKFANMIISLDNRRVPFPRSSQPKIFSIRSSDQPADPGVLPSAEEQRKYRIKIVKVNTTHNDMGGMGTDEQKKEINNYILDFLSRNP